MRLGGCSIGDHEAIKLAETLVANIVEIQHNRALKVLHLSKNYLSYKPAIEVATALEVNIALTELHLARCTIDSESEPTFAKTLKLNSGLVELDLSCNMIEKGAYQFVEALKSNTVSSLERLHIYFNDIPYEDCKKIINANDNRVIIEVPSNFI